MLGPTALPAGGARAPASPNADADLRHGWTVTTHTARAIPWVGSPAPQSKQNWVLTNHGIASRYNPVGTAICVNPIGEPGRHAFTHQPPKCCSFRGGFRKRKR